MEKLIKKDLKIRQTKLIATLGITSEKKDLIKFIEEGVTCFRLNFSHGTLESHQKNVDNTREIIEEYNLPISLMVDTRGPEIRTGNFIDGEARILEGKEVTFRFLSPEKKDALSSDKEIWVNVNLPKILATPENSKVTKILLDDGQLIFKIIKINKQEENIKAKALNSWTITNYRGVNIPNLNNPMNFLNEYEKTTIKFAYLNCIEYIALSFVSKKEDVSKVENYLVELEKEFKFHWKPKLIPKIENNLAVTNFNEILENTSGIMIARGDLAVEIPYEETPRLEKRWIKECAKKGKISIVATQMLQSMVNNPTPTRAEVTDVFIAQYWGADSTMLSGESANGNFPFKAVKTMNRILRNNQNLPQRTKSGMIKIIDELLLREWSDTEKKKIDSPSDKPIALLVVNIVDQRWTSEVEELINRIELVAKSRILLIIVRSNFKHLLEHWGARSLLWAIHSQTKWSEESILTKQTNSYWLNIDCKNKLILSKKK